MLEGIIVKGIGGFYYVKTENGIFECRARGLFREENLVPLVGDRVKIRISPEDNTGYIKEIKPRESQLLRPPVANITQTIIIMSIKEPNINLWLLDRFLVMAEFEGLNIHVCINKVDLERGDKVKEINNIYSKAGYSIINTSIIDNKGIDELREKLKNNITVFAGPSGVGKSSLLNKIHPGLNLKTGDISRKTTRGKHTTRHVELIEIDSNSYVLDSPGFSSLDLSFIEREEDLGFYFKEIKEYSGDCKFISCVHYKEPDCEVKRQLEKGNISNSRYENYLNFLDEIKSIRRY
ncbi:MAG: ribosome small subunit-dependent GTPase A [Tissierellia bacterium]|nr:ribosome small subunit-dependent GTPase A [Tissierellia bacterium]